MKQLFIHIGTHKTGTTSFQKSLVVNAKALKDQGIRPILPSHHIVNGKRIPAQNANHVTLAHLFVRPELKTDARIRKIVPTLTERQREQRLERFLERLSEMNEDKLVLSSETFCLLRKPQEQAKVAGFFERLGRKVTTLVVFRNEADWREGWITQLRKSGPRHYEKITSGPNHLSVSGDWYFDKSAMSQFWSPFNLREICYEDHENIVETLYREIGAQSDDLDTAIFRNVRQQSKAV